MNKATKFMLISISSIFLLAIVFMTMNKLSPIALGLYSEIATKNNFAIDGYDPVAYFEKNKAIKGNEKFTYKWKDATWIFLSDAHLNKFKNTPDTYTPQYGGHCAFAASKGVAALANPTTWSIENDKLYLYAEDAVLKIGDNFSMNTNSCLVANGGRIYIGDNVLIAQNVVVRAANHNHDSVDIPIKDQGHKGGAIHIEDGVWIGANSVIVTDVTIGKHSIVGAGAVVTKDVMPFTIVGGVPAKLIRHRTNLTE